MPVFAWNTSYTVGVDRFDKEHQQLFEIMNELYEGMKAGRGKDVLDSVLKKLLRYTQQHFSGEESVMRGAGYPDLPSQVAEHREFTTRIGRFIQDFEAGAVALSVELLEYLRDWLSGHIAGSDKRYTAFLNAKGIR